VNAPEKIRLTQYSHGGGCGCKIAPGILSDLLQKNSSFKIPKDLLVGIESADDAAVYRLNDQQAIVATTDFFTPIVDEPYDFGRIAATNAISDVYAMGARPILALAVVGMPLDKLPVNVIRAILEGGESVCAAAGIPVAGGHSIDVQEPIYGLVVLGLVHPDRVKRNNSAKPDDVLVLGKPLGIGILSAALKNGQLSGAGYATMLDWTTRLNTAGQALGELAAVHAMTDVTGFGLAGHLLEICRGSGLAAEIAFDDLPIIEDARALAQQGVATGASDRNWTGYGGEVALPDGFGDWKRKLLSDPQTSGGLLVACSPDAVGEVRKILGNPAKVIGRLTAGKPGLRVT